MTSRKDLALKVEGVSLSDPDGNTGPVPRSIIMSYILIRIATADLVFAGLLSPANATCRPAPMVFRDLLSSAIAHHGSTVLPTSRLPWLVPIGHRQPSLAEVPQSDAVSA